MVHTSAACVGAKELWGYVVVQNIAYYVYHRYYVSHSTIHTECIIIIITVPPSTRSIFTKYNLHASIFRITI